MNEDNMNNENDNEGAKLALRQETPADMAFVGINSSVDGMERTAKDLLALDLSGVDPRVREAAAKAAGHLAAAATKLRLISQKIEELI